MKLVGWLLIAGIVVFFYFVGRGVGVDRERARYEEIIRRWSEK